MTSTPRPPDPSAFVDLARQWQAAGNAWLQWWLGPLFRPGAMPGQPAPTAVPPLAIGRDVAATPGSVVHRNDLIELIQYAPSTPRVMRRPLLVVPSCFGRHYLLDATPANSFVRWVVAQGHMVFVVSWRNLPADLRQLGVDAYVRDGVLAALGVAKSISGSATVNVLGHGGGGTLLAMALAILAARRERTVASATLLATMLDFADPGDAGAVLASDKAPAADLAYWAADTATPAPALAAWYRDALLQRNLLREPGGIAVAGAAVDLGRITVPTFVLAACHDRVAPWRTAYRGTALVGGDVVFVLASGGHADGIVAPPGSGAPRHWTNELVTDGAADWLERAAPQPGSWWPHWAAWLARYAGAPRTAPSRAGSDTHPPLGPAPGLYATA